MFLGLPSGEEDDIEYALTWARIIEIDTVAVSLLDFYVQSDVPHIAEVFGLLRTCFRIYDFVGIKNAFDVVDHVAFGFLRIAFGCFVTEDAFGSYLCVDLPGDEVKQFFLLEF